jgi:ketosteroid isomerase-like protein
MRSGEPNERRHPMVRTLVMCGALAALVVSLTACSTSEASSTAEQEMRRNADRWEIDQLEKKFHQATTKHDIDLMLSLYAPHATLIFASNTAVGKKQIRKFWLETSTSFKKNWISNTPAYKVKITVNGDRGTLFFECHYTDPKTEKVESVTGADADVQRIGGRWLITNLTGASATLKP